MSNGPSSVVIVGGGPAGASAAVFTARAGLETVVVDADKGITRRAMLNNHLGFPDGIPGPELVERGRAHAVTSGATWVEDSAEAIEVADGTLTVRTAGGQSFTAANVILATGTSVALAEASGVATSPGTEPHIKKVVAVDSEGRSSVPGVWAAGTAAGVSVHTVVTAGDGARVALNLLSELHGERHADHDVLPAG